MSLRRYIKHLLIYCISYSFILFSAINIIYADEIDWVEVAKTNDGIQFIDSNSIKYDNRGVLSVITKYSDINTGSQSIIGANSYLMAIDCENRLYSKFPVNAEFKQVKDWLVPTNDKLIKKTIIKSCSY